MLGGLAKQDCEDPSDPGEYCWSGPTKAAIIAAYFYGNWLQVRVVETGMSQNAGHLFNSV